MRYPLKSPAVNRKTSNTREKKWKIYEESNESWNWKELSRLLCDKAVTSDKPYFVCFSDLDRSKIAPFCLFVYFRIDFFSIEEWLSWKMARKKRTGGGGRGGKKEEEEEREEEDEEEEELVEDGGWEVRK